MLLSITNLKKSYIVDKILDDVNLIVENRDKIGLIGNNGSGKTTLFNIITGEISKDSGHIFMPKNIKIGYLKQQLNEKGDISIYDECLKSFSHLIKMEGEMKALEEAISNPKNTNLEEDVEKYSNLHEEFQKLDGYSYPSKIRGTLIGLAFETSDFSKSINQLSGGQKSRLALAKLLLSEPDLLLLDEPTNHLDISSISWLEKYIKDYKGAVLVISHDRFFLDNVTNKIALLEHKKLTTYNGNYTTFMKQRKKDLELLKKQYEDQQKEIKRQEKIVDRFMNMGRDRLIKQGQSRKKLLDKMEKLDPPSSTKKVSLRFSPKFESGQDVLKLENISKSFDNKIIFENISFNIYKGEKVGLIGPNGVGKSTIFKILTGKLLQNSGEIKFGAKVQLAYFDQEMENLNLENTVIDEIWDEFPKLNHYEIRSYLAKFLFVGDDIFKMIDDLSGGEKGRLSLLKIMLRGANFLLLDEPTNHLDIDSKESLEDALKVYDGTVLAISHDRYFLNAICEKTLVMKEDGIDEYLGNYDYYLEKTSVIEDIEDNYISKTEIQNQKKILRDERNKIKEEKKLKEDLENKIQILENEISSIDEELSNPEIYEDFERVQKLSSLREEKESALNSLYDKYFNLDN